MVNIMQVCDKCGKKDYVMYVKPGGVMICPECEDELRKAAKLKDKEK